MESQRSRSQSRENLTPDGVENQEIARSPSEHYENAPQEESNAPSENTTKQEYEYDDGSKNKNEGTSLYGFERIASDVLAILQILTLMLRKKICVESSLPLVRLSLLNS